MNQRDPSLAVGLKERDLETTNRNKPRQGCDNDWKLGSNTQSK